MAKGRKNKHKKATASQENHLSDNFMDFHSNRLQQLNEDIGTMTFTINGVNQSVSPEESGALSDMLGSPLTSSYAKNSYTQHC